MEGTQPLQRSEAPVETLEPQALRKDLGQSPTTPHCTATATTLSESKPPERPRPAQAGQGNLISGAWTERTVNKHLVLLKDFGEFALKLQSTSGKFRADVRREGDTLHVTPRVIDAYLIDRRNNPRIKTRTGDPHIKWSAVQTIMGNLMGAIRDSRMHGAHIMVHDEGKMMQKIDRTLEKRSNAEPTLFPYAAPYESVQTAQRTLRKASKPLNTLAALYLQIWHATAARPQDPLCLQKGSIKTFREVQGMRVWSITYLKGKGVILRGPYTVHTIMPDDSLLLRILEMPGEYLFPQDKAEDIHKLALTALKEVDRRIEQRSIRRGALQELAMTDADESTLLMFSGHRDAQMLWRYLGWGQRRGKVQRCGAEAAIAAWVTPQNNK